MFKNSFVWKLNFWTKGRAIVISINFIGSLYVVCTLTCNHLINWNAHFSFGEICLHHTMYLPHYIKSKLKIPWNFYENWGMVLVLFKSLLWVGFHEGDLIIFKLKMKKILNFESFLSLKIHSFQLQKISCARPIG